MSGARTSAGHPVQQVEDGTRRLVSCSPTPFPLNYITAFLTTV